MHAHLPAFMDCMGGFSPANLSGNVLWLRGDLGATTLNPAFDAPKAFDNAAWTKSNTTVNANAVANPVDGTVDADELVEVAGTTLNRQAYDSITSMRQGKDAIVSVYAKSNGCQFLYMSANSASQYGFYDLQNGTLGTFNGGSSGTITDVGDGWYLCRFSFNTSPSFSIGMTRSDSSLFYTVTGGDEQGIYLYDATVEQNNVTALADQSPTADSFAQGNISFQPTIYTPDYIDFAQADFLAATSPASKWRFLHNGAGATFFDVWDSTGEDTSRVLWQTQATITSGQVGAFARALSPGQLQVGFANGSAWFGLVSVAAPAGKHFACVRWEDGRAPDEYVVRVDGTQLANGNWSGTPASGDSTQTLEIGNPVSAGYEMGHGEHIMYDRWLSDAEVAQVESYLAARYGL